MKIDSTTYKQLQEMIMQIHAKNNAPASQNVRNFKPLHRLIVDVLPNTRGRAIPAEEIFTEINKIGRVEAQTLFSTLAKMKSTGAIKGVRFANVPMMHYYFSL